MNPSLVLRRSFSLSPASLSSPLPPLGSTSRSSCLIGALALLLLASWGSPASGYPNQGGTIILHDANLVWCVDASTYCGLGSSPASCAEADTRLDGTWEGTAKVFKVYAAFPDGSAPRLKAMAFGVHYSGSDIVVVGWGPCIGELNNGAGEYPGPGWPGPDTGTAIVFQHTQTSRLVECYWFAAYNDSAPGPAIFQLRDNPDPAIGGCFIGDGVIDDPEPIAGYGSLGFDTDGEAACPTIVMGACCIPDTGGCLALTEEDCENWVHPHEYMGDGTYCDPDGSCPEPVAVEESSWGRIKRHFR